jgi:signal transduction histidine kinase
MKPYVFKVFFFFFVIQPLFAQKSQNIQVLYLKDSNSNFSIDSLEEKSDNFKVFENIRLSYGHENKPHWLKISVSNNDTISQKKLLEVDYAFLEEVNLFIVQNGKIIYKSDTIGWKYPYKKRVFKHYNPVFPITIDAQSSQTIYLRIFRRYISLLPTVKVWNESDFYQNEINRKFIWGGFGGILLLASSFGMILFLVLGKRLYLLYALYVSMALLYSLIDRGFFFEYYNDGFLGFYKKNFRQLLMNLNILFTLLYVREYVFTNYKLKFWLLQIFRFCIVLCFLAISLLWFEKYSSEHHIVISDKAALLYPFSFIMPALFSFYLVFYSYFKKIDVVASKFYMIGALPLVLFTVLTNLRHYNLIPNFWFLEIEGAMLAYIFDVLILALGLGYRYKILRTEKEKLVEEKKQNQLLVYEKGLELQNQERSRLAKELHDGLGIDISIIKMKLEALGMDLEKKGFLAKEFHETIANLDNLASNVRSFSHNIMPPDLEKNGIAIVLENLVYSLQKLSSKVEINFTTNISDKLEGKLSQNLYFIAKELINNALRHSNASIIDVELMKENNRTELKVSDNGIGYDFEKALKKDGLGLESINSRVALINAHFVVTKKPSSGVSHKIIHKSIGF